MFLKFNCAKIVVQIITISPSLDMKRALSEFIEYVMSGFSNDELGDVLFFLGIENRWSLRKRLWRNNVLACNAHLRLKLISNDAFLLNYNEFSTRFNRQEEFLVTQFEIVNFRGFES